VFSAGSASRIVSTAVHGFCGITTTKTPAYGREENPDFVVLGDALGYVAGGLALDVVAMGYARASPGLALVA
jgi:hypothetical protein